MLPNVVKVLYGIGALGLLVGWSLFIRMTIELNRTLPPQKKFALVALRMHFHEVKRLHEESFPVSTLRATWFALMVFSVTAMAVAVIIAVKPK
jgi:hypothetical protein